MNDVVWRAVRCCCQPTKVLGFLRADPNVRCLMVPMIGGSVALELRQIHDPRFGSEVAVYSEDRGIDFWRKVPGFVEAADPAGLRGRI